MKNLLYALYLFIFLAFASGLEAQEDSLSQSQILDSLLYLSKNSQAEKLIVWKEGEILLDWKSENCDSLYFNTASLVKSISGMAIGVLVDKGYIESEDDLYCDYVSDWEDGCKNNVTIKQLLTMCSGHNRKRGASGILAAKNLHEFALATVLDTLPGIRFAYSNEAVQLLGVLLERTSGMTMSDFYDKYLFQALEMDSTSLYKDEFGQDCPFGGAKMTMQDLLNFGIMVLSKGKFKGHQVVSSDWVEKSLSPSQLASFYGYLWWMGEANGFRNVTAMGDGGQVLTIYPEKKLIVLRSRSCERSYNNMQWLAEFGRWASRI